MGEGCGAVGVAAANPLGPKLAVEVAGEGKTIPPPLLVAGGVVMGGPPVA